MSVPVTKLYAEAVLSPHNAWLSTGADQEVVIQTGVLELREHVV